MANPNPSPETRFKAGGPGGPGRPRSRPITDRLRERLASEPGLVDEVIDSWLLAAKTGDIRALRELLLRLEGRPEAETARDVPLTVVDAIRALDQVERALGLPPTEET